VAAIDGVAGTAVADALAARENVANAWLSMHMPGRKRLNLCHPPQRPRTSRLVRCFVNTYQAVTQFKHIVPSTQWIEFLSRISKQITHLNEIMMNCAFLVRSLI
jgi:hypothetical protein